MGRTTLEGTYAGLLGRSAVGMGIPVGMGMGMGIEIPPPRQPCGYFGMFAVSAIEILNVICKWIIARARLPSVGFRS